MENMRTKSKIKIGLVQINNSFANQNYLPYSVGLLQAFAEKYLSNKDSFEFLLPIYKRIPVKFAVENLLQADMVFFSTYVWNFKISLEMARQIKKNKPDAMIVFGGPQVPNKGIENFLRSYSFIDIACQGEGEKTFLSILENYARGDWAKVPSISYVNKTGEFIQTPLGSRISELDKIPSPYISGVFERLMEVNPEQIWLGLWETNRGCPFSCTYCVWGASTQNKVYAYNIQRLYGEIDWFSRKKIEFVFCCDANFGILKRDFELVRRYAENKRRYDYPKVLSAQSTKNCTEHSYNIYKIMGEAGLNKGVALALQSLNKKTLEDVGRKNIPLKSFKEMQQRLTSANIETFTDILLGLPSETYETFVDGVSSVIKNGQHNRIQFGNLSILPGAEMDDPEYQKKFGFNIVETKVLNMHGSLSATEEVEETQRMVMGTNTMPKKDWVRTRAFSWMTALLHFDKLLQVPFVILHKIFSVSYRNLIEIFTEAEEAPPVLSQIRSFFVDKAIEMQCGGSEFCESKEWLNIWWPADESILVKLCTENKLMEFYKQAEQLIGGYLRDRKLCGYEPILHDSIFLNQNLIKLPFQDKDLEVCLSYNIWDVYHAALRGIDVPLKKGKFCYKIDRTSTKWPSWEQWCQKVVWYGNKKGAYFYNVLR